MEKLTFSVHPLFLLFGALYALGGRLNDFLVYTLSALLHECAHAYAAARMGYTLDKIVLMPYGAAVKGDISGIRKKEEIVLCLAGPLANAACAAVFVASWWFFPDCYPYTEPIVSANAALCLVNLLPALPLDGGRILFCLLKGRLGERGAERAGKAAGVCLALFFFAAFVLSLPDVSLSLLVFAVFLLVGCFQKDAGRYGKIKFDYTKSFARGVEVKRVAVDENCEIGKLLRFFSEETYLTADVYSVKGDYLGSLRQEEIAALFEKYGIYGKIKEFLPKTDRFGLPKEAKNVIIKRY